MSLETNPTGTAQRAPARAIPAQETARSHLASVFLKTETRRQAQLTRLICEAAAALRL